MKLRKFRFEIINRENTLPDKAGNIESRAN